MLVLSSLTCTLFSFTATATTEIYTLSLHDALPICNHAFAAVAQIGVDRALADSFAMAPATRAFCVRCLDRKSTRLNSSHVSISYAVFCLKKKKRNHQ